MKRIVLVLILFLFALTTYAQDAAQPFGAVTDNALSIYGLSAQPIPVSTAPNNGIFDVEWSRDGSRLAYLLTDENFTSQLYVTDASGSEPIRLDAGDMEGGFPITFTGDGNILYIGRTQLSGTDNTGYRADVKQIAPEAGAQPQTLGTFEYHVGCGGGSPLPADWRYWEEAGFGGNYLTLEMTDFGLLHSTNCTGLGLAVLNLQTGEDRFIGPDMTRQQGTGEGYGRARLSPDGKQVAALYTRYVDPLPARTLTIIDLATLNPTEVKTADLPDQIAWGMDGTLFYSTQTFKANLVEALTEQEKQKLAETNTTDMPGNEVSIHHINPANGDAQVIYQADAYAVGRMAASADGKALLFSQVAGLDAWIKAIADGTLDVVQDSNGAAQRALVPVALFQIDLASSQATRIGDNLAHFVLRPV